MDDKPVTRKELTEALSVFATKAELREAIATAKTEIIAEVVAKVVGEMRDIVAEIVRDSQTKILRAFLTYQENNDLRLRTIEAKVANLDTGLSERVNNVERRLWEIEKRLLLNPPAA
jgi:cytidylate kinase